MKNSRDVVVLIICLVVIFASIFFGYKLLNPNKNNQTVTEQPLDSESKYVDVNIDEQTYKDISSLKKYPKPSLTDIGKSDLFAPPATVAN